MYYRWDGIILLRTLQNTKLGKNEPIKTLHQQLIA